MYSLQNSQIMRKWELNIKKNVVVVVVVVVAAAAVIVEKTYKINWSMPQNSHNTKFHKLQ